jgi:hypothetical protein
MANFYFHHWLNYFSSFFFNAINVFYAWIKPILTYEWVKLILTTAIGGLITYAYVMRKENKREARTLQREKDRVEQEKKEKCTKALLCTQMAISLQMTAVKNIEDITKKFLNFNLCGASIEERFKDDSELYSVISSFYELMNKEKFPIKEVVPLTTHDTISPYANNIIDFPYEIFELPNLVLDEKIIVHHLILYFQQLAICNRNYSEIISLIMWGNDRRDQLIKELISLENKESYGYIIGGKFIIYRQLNAMIQEYLKEANKAFCRAKYYIELIKILPPILKNEQGEIIINENT